MPARSRRSTVTKEQKGHYCLDTVRGMEYLSGLGFVHRDLAARNVHHADFDMVLVHRARVFQPSTAPLAPCAMFCLVSILTGCWVVSCNPMLCPIWGLQV